MKRDSILRYAIPGSAVEGHEIYNTSQKDGYEKDFADHSHQNDEALGAKTHQFPEFYVGLQDEPLGAKIPEPHQFPEFYVGLQNDEPLEEPRQLLFQTAILNPAPEMEIFSPKPIREYATHKILLEPEMFEDWSVDLSEPVLDHEELGPEWFEDWHLDMGERICGDEALNREHLSFSSKTPSSLSKLRKSFPARHYTPYPGFGGDDKDDDESVEADSPTLPRPVLQLTSIQNDSEMC